MCFSSDHRKTRAGLRISRSQAPLRVSQEKLHLFSETYLVRRNQRMYTTCHSQGQCSVLPNGMLTVAPRVSPPLSLGAFFAKARPLLSACQPCYSPEELTTERSHHGFRVGGRASYVAGHRPAVRSSGTPAARTAGVATGYTRADRGRITSS